MKLEEMQSILRIELQDRTPETRNYTDDELARAVEKSVSLMSRMLPKRNVAETTIVLAISGETLTIASSTGTLAYKPVKKGSLTITSKTLDTDYRINYLTGVVTEIGSNLTDGAYTATYTLDDTMLDMSSFLTDFIKIDRVEYPAGNSPPTNPTFDVIGGFLTLRAGNTSLSANEHLRVQYLCKWTPPTKETDGDYPSHLNDAVIIGSVGQSLIYKAEKYTQEAANTVLDVTTILAGIASIVPTLDTLTAPTAPTLDTLTPPTGYTISAPSAPTIPSVPTAPTAPTLSFTDVGTALTAIGTEITAAKAHITTGAALANAATRGDNVAAVYAQYAGIVMDATTARYNEAVARLRQIEEDLTKYASQVTSYGSEVNGYANNISGLVGKYNAEINAQQLGVQNASSEANVFASEVQYQSLLVNKFAAEVNAYQAQIQKVQNDVNFFVGQANAIINRTNQMTVQANSLLDIAGRFLSSGQAKINEMLVMLGIKTEFNFQKSSSEQRS
jgi:archaellum component FlaC